MKLITRETSGQLEHDQSSPLSPLMRRVLAARGIDSADELDFSLKHLHPVTALAHVDKAAAILAESIRAKQHILIVGDFDADGATATALACRALRQMGCNTVNYLVPNRFEYGYGLTAEIVAEAQRFAPHLIVTVDNGISSIDGVRIARKAGIKVLVTDHHLPGRELPEADVMVNPNLADDEFPSKSLAGVGVIFYVMLALKRLLMQQDYFAQQNLPEPNLISLLDLVALGTVADVVPLDRNNRILVEQGLRRIRSGQCCAGIQALFTVAGANIQRAVAADFGFLCGPRLNAAGRLDDMSLGIECLLSDSLPQALEIAAALDDLNRERRAIENSMKDEAMRELEQLNLDRAESVPPIFCLYRDSWHQGVVGILASRIKEQFNRPVIAFAPCDNGELKGSARSIQGIHMRDLLDELASQNPGLLEKFGGHAMAAGLSLHPSRFKAFSERITALASRYNDDDTFQQRHYTDGDLPASEFSIDTAEQLRALAPWGQNFPPPVFDGRFILAGKKLLKNIHLSMQLELCDQRSQRVRAIAFNINPQDWPDEGGEVHILYRFDVNEYQGLVTPQIVVERLLQ